MRCKVCSTSSHPLRNVVSYTLKSQTGLGYDLIQQYADLLDQKTPLWFSTSTLAFPVATIWPPTDGVAGRDVFYLVGSNIGRCHVLFYSANVPSHLSRLLLASELSAGEITRSAKRSWSADNLVYGRTKRSRYGSGIRKNWYGGALCAAKAPPSAQSEQKSMTILFPKWTKKD